MLFIRKIRNIFKLLCKLFRNEVCFVYLTYNRIENNNNFIEVLQLLNKLLERMLVLS
jgi:hypothetical protein